MNKIYQFNKIINTYESIPDTTINPTVPLNYFQEAAQRQLESLGLGVEFLLRKNLGWILVKYEIDYYKYPKAEEEVIIETEPTSYNRFEAFRRFSIKSKEGEELISGKSVWVLIDTKTRKLVQMTNVKELENLLSKDGEKYRIPRLTKVDDFDNQKTFSVRYLDIDINYHVNNVKYLAWALEGLPLDIVLENEIKKLIIIYKEQAYYGEKVVVRTKELEELKWRINIEREDGTVLCEIEIVGRKRENRL